MGNNNNNDDDDDDSTMYGTLSQKDTTHSYKYMIKKFKFTSVKLKIILIIF